MNYQFILPVWGPDYLETFLRYSLPTQLSPGNLGSLKNRQGITYSIYTRSQDVKVISSALIFKKLQQLVKAEIIIIPDIHFNTSDHYQPFNTCYRQGIDKAFQGGAALLFLCADQIWADGSFANIIKLGDAGKRAVMISGPRVMQETFIIEFNKRYSRSQDNSYLSLSFRDTVRLAMDHLHPWDKSLFWDQENMGRPASFLFWKVKEQGFLMRCFHLHPILVNPQKFYPDFSATIDGGDFVEQVCPDFHDLYIVEDSDEVMYFSLAPASQSADLVKIPKMNWIGLMIWAAYNKFSKHNLYYLNRPIRFHVTDRSADWNQVESVSNTIVCKIKRHFDHAIWIKFIRLAFRVYQSVLPLIKHGSFAHRSLKRILGIRTVSC